MSRALLILRWQRVEPGLWAAASYVLKKVRRFDRFFWRVYRDNARWGRCKTLRNAKELCAMDYARQQTGGAP